MVVFNTYTGFQFWFRYYFLKFLPQNLYIFFTEYYYEKYIKLFIKQNSPMTFLDKINQKKYYNRHKFKPINIKNPQKFTDKINYLKLHDVTLQKTMLTDKLLVKDYIKATIPELNTAKVYQAVSSFDELDFFNAPEKFIIKTNHACKTGRIVKNKNQFSIEEYEKYKKYYKKVLKINYAFWGILELQYKYIKPKIYIEEYLENENKNPLDEYEVYCFNGNIEFIQKTSYINNIINNAFYNADWQKCDYNLFCEKQYIKPPDEYIREKIIEYSKILSKDFKFVRIDFFIVNKEIYFGEMTFTPFTGHIRLVPEEYDEILGKKLVI